MHFFSHTNAYSPTFTLDTYAFRYTHVPSFVGFLCGVLFENKKEVLEGGGFKMKRKQRGLATGWWFHSLLPSPYLNANSKHQVVCSRDERSHGQGPEKVLVPEDSWLLLSFSLNNKNHKKTFIWTTEIALLYRIIFIILIIMGLYLRKLGSNWERKVPRKYMVIRTFKNSIQNLVGKRGKEVRAAP